MQVENYACDVCKEKLVNCDELIGFSIKENGESFYPEPIEKATCHICGPCLTELAAFQKKWNERKTMSQAQLHAWGLSW